VSDTVIRVENLGKKYIIDQQQQRSASHKTLRDAMVDGARAIRSRLMKPANTSSSEPSRKEFWALKDVSFEIKRGDRVGIIGRNGAGKSTLLKILSRITEPTTGRISITGRVASLLEVGTGFHAELTGRENIYLNGAILGMSKIEISKRFDEIVDFAEVAKFLDTPVKRYSSGMYVRLAFAVAAHLEPEILIVDEVLAVGDLQFQKKCLGKIQDVSQNEERTVLFVSHNMEVIQRLCSYSVMLERGQVITQGSTTNVVAHYLSTTANLDKVLPNQWVELASANRMGSGEARFIAVRYSSLNKHTDFQAFPEGVIEFSLEIESSVPRNVESLAVVIFDQSGTKLVNADTLSVGHIISLKQGNNIVSFKIKQLHLNSGTYVIGLWLANSLTGEVFDWIESAFEIDVVNFEAEGFGVRPPFDGVVTCDFELSLV
jgi:ABC-type polysaccharide/polyol phosphate transport system ATPase subunit